MDTKRDCVHGFAILTRRRDNPEASEQPVSEPEHLQIVLTPEQRELVRRHSGQVVEAIELVKDVDDTKPTGGPLRFLWRLSDATGIPRQRWTPDDAQSSSQPD